MKECLIPVVIADDEYLIRSLIRNSLDWEGMGYQIIGEAEDGEEALQMAEDLHPRLMIVDINMPFINGLDLAATIRQRFSCIKIIILTGYEDFQYARKAIQAGVLNYLLKPIKPDEMSEVLYSTRQKILLEERNSLFSIQNKVQKIDPAPDRLKERFLRTLISPGVTQERGEILGRFHFFNLSLKGHSFVICLADEDIGDSFSISPLKEGEVFTDLKGRSVFICNVNPDIKRMKSQSFYSLLFSIMSERKQSGLHLTVGISDPVKSAVDLYKAYLHAEKALEEKYYQGRNNIFIYDDMSATKNISFSFPTVSYRDDLLLILRSGNGKRVNEFVMKYLADLSGKGLPRQYAETACLEILILFNEFLEENGRSLQHISKKDKDLYDLIADFKTFSELCTWVGWLLEEGMNSFDSSRSGKTLKLVSKAKIYIERNFQKNIALDHIAEYSGVSSSYLSSIFKKEFGISVIEYLTDCRLKKAKDIMDEFPLIPVGDVAGRVGYSDPYYFSKCFRKQFGLSPSKYLKNKISFV